jgi:ethanolamine utilization protein EutN
MIMGKVIGNIWATRKDQRLNGIKLLVVQPISYNNSDSSDNPADAAVTAPCGTMIAGDIIGAGVGERVLVVTGSSARTAAGDVQIPIDATVVGIIDEEKNGG